MCAPPNELRLKLPRCGDHICTRRLVVSVAAVPAALGATPLGPE
jgi:hypothetical protein